jgi:formylmethanofuran dehydrogenase subunit C
MKKKGGNMKTKLRVFKKQTAKAQKVLVNMRDDGKEGVLIFLTDNEGEQLPGTNLMRIDSGGISLFGSVDSQAGIELTDGYVTVREN